VYTYSIMHETFIDFYMDSLLQWYRLILNITADSFLTCYVNGNEIQCILPDQIARKCFRHVFFRVPIPTRNERQPTNPALAPSQIYLPTCHRTTEGPWTPAFKPSRKSFI